MFLPLRVVTYYVNVRPSASKWRRQVLGPFSKSVLMPPAGPVFGVRSFEEFETIVSDYRAFVSRWADLGASGTVPPRELISELDDRGRLRFARHLYNPTTRRLSPTYKTENLSFSEMLYSHLALALQAVPPPSIRRCVMCDNLFVVGSGQRAKYCSGRCRLRMSMRRYRKRQSCRAADIDQSLG